MTTARWRQIENLFNEALIFPPSERSQFLERACEGDAELLREIESLLDHDSPGERLVDIPEPLLTEATEEAGSMEGRRIGSYRVIRLIGRGGMGAVYLGSRDDDEYQKYVAIKILKRGMDTDFMLSRFRQERQILANLEHPFIARLIDGGATDDGLPYLVMEYVDGVPITDYCDAKQLSVPERIRLFNMVCEAVQHAHQNLVVHRDIKPGNILTTKEGIPKLLDFGIAKMIDPGYNSGVTITQGEYRMFTPDYASPEQVMGLPVNTASDVYSLGAVLYQLLTGTRAHRFTSTSPTDLERAICQVEPMRPGLAAANNERLPAASRKQLKRLLSGDLDNIVLTALRKEPQRRYASSSEFGDDLKRHLDGLPVLAHEDRWSYRAGKFIRRNRVAVGTLSLLVVSLVAGMIATTIQARRAEQRFQIVRGLAKSMLFDLYSEMERIPGSISLRAATVRTVVNYLDALASSGSRDPELDLEIATAYERVAILEGHPFASNLGHGSEALTNYQKALTIFERLSTQPAYRRQATRGLIDTHLRMATMESLFGRPASSLAHSQKASEIAGLAFAPGAAEIPHATQINVYVSLADLANNRGDAGVEVANTEKALAVAQKWAEQDRGASPAARLIEAYRSLGSARGRGGDLVGSLESYRIAANVGSAVAKRNDLRQDDQFWMVNVQTSIGDLLGAPDDPNFNDVQGALARYQEALTIAERLAAVDPKNVNGGRLVAGCYWRLGMILSRDQPDRAIGFCRKGQQLAEKLGAGDPNNVEYQYHLSRLDLWLGEALRNARRYPEAIDSLTRSVQMQQSIASRAPQRIWNLRVLSRAYVYLGAAYLDAGDPDQAIHALTTGLDVADRMLQRAPSSLSHQIDRADVLEGIGHFYATQARSPAIERVKKAELRQRAIHAFEASLAIWQGWTKRNVGLPYTKRRADSARAEIARIGGIR